MAKDPYRYFRVEARELIDGLALGVLGVEKGAQGAKAIGNLLRLAHTLKGAARVVKQAAIADAAHAIEEVLAPHREGAVVPKSSIAQLLALIDGATLALKEIESQAEAQQPASEPQQGGWLNSAAQAGAALGAGSPKPAAQARAPETVRVDLAELDAVTRGLQETSVQLSALRQLAARLDESASRALGNAVEQVERELLQVRDTAERLRLLSASALFGSLERAVRDAAELLGKPTGFRASAGENRIDAHVLTKLGEALLHVVRNAVAHGIEPAAERVALGKPAVGLVELSVERRARNLIFIVRDDGRGLDLEAIRAVAVQRGLVPPAESPALGIERAVELLLHGGVSTTAVADSTSGRGVGLEVVRAVMAEVRGQVSVQSEPGRGTTLELTMPISLAAVNALQAVSSGQTISIPLNAVAKVLRIDAGSVAISDSRASIDYQGRAIPYLQLWQALRLPAPEVQSKIFSVILVRSGDSLTAVLVDRLLGAAELVTRPLPVMPVDPIVAGSSFDADGNPCLLLDPAGIALAARTQRPVASEKIGSRPPVLIVDDSLTTRMLEQSILESAGYEVELATSGEEGLEKARAKKFGLFLVDVEMPGISGFEFVARTQADPVLRETPAMLVTSLGSDEDKRRGKEAGARAYILKGEFDQSRLLDTIRHLMG